MMPNLAVPPEAAASAAAPTESDRFRYGWRSVKRILTDGTEAWDEVPLTLDEVLHPQEDYVISENTIHEPERGHLAGAFRTRLSRLHNGHVFSDCIIDWDVPGLGNHSPDISVFEDVRGLPLPQLGTFRRAEFGGICRTAVEIVSPSTRRNDVIKLEHYHRAGVRQYVMIDQQSENGPRRLIDNRWTPNGYVQEPLDANGRVVVPSLGLLLGLRDNRIYILDADTRDEIGELAQEYANRVKAQERADDEKRRADDEKRRADDEKRRTDDEKRRAEDEKRRAEDEKRRAEDEKRRADDEKHRADDEKRRADAAEAELDRLRALLKQPIGGNGPAARTPDVS